MKWEKTSSRTTLGRKGISLIEVAMGLGIMSLVALGVVQVTNEQNEATRALGAASQLDTMRAATHDWVRANYQQLAANLPVGGAPVLIPVARTVPGGAVPAPVTVGAATLPSLQGGGFVAATTIDRNAYGQSHAVMVRQPASGSIEALVLQTGGRPVRDADLGRIVQRVGQSGGARFVNVTAPGMATMVQGNGGAWMADSGTWTVGGVTPQVSRAAAVVSFGNASMLSDFLNRYDIGLPEANTMRTAMNMGGNDINNAATVRANQAVLHNGGVACASNATGCSFWISDDGRLSDFNDGWIRFQGFSAGGGLAIEGTGANLWVQNNVGIGGGLDVAQNATVRNDLVTMRDTWTGRNSWVGGDSGVGGSLDVAQNATVRGNFAGLNDGLFGRNLNVVGRVNSAQVWSGYVNSTGNIDAAGSLNVGQSASIWGPGGLFVQAGITTPGTVQAGFMRSTGSVDAGMDLNATRNVNAQARVTGVDGIRTLAQRVPMSACDFTNESGMIAISTVDGSLLQCTAAGRWLSVIPGSLGAMDLIPWAGATNRPGSYVVSARCRDPGFFISFSNPETDAGMLANPSIQFVWELLPPGTGQGGGGVINGGEFPAQLTIRPQCVSSGLHSGRTRYDYFITDFY